MFAAASYFFVTDRCHEERHFLRPDPAVLEIVAAALRKAIGVTDVGVLCWVLMGNHWHILVRIPNEVGALPAFMQRLKSEVARAVNEHLGRRGTFWSDRYHAIPIVDDASLIDRMLYILMNPVAAGLSATSAEYPGLSSLEANLGIRAACGNVDVPIELPPQWANLDAAELAVQRAQLRDQLRARENAVKEDRRRRGLPRPKPERCLRVDPFDRPQQPARRRAPNCFAATIDAKRVFAELRKSFVAAYRWASEQFRSGLLDVMFPAGAFPPRLSRPPVEAAA
jgi:REP element-mobilizing transposase RayT